MVYIYANIELEYSPNQRQINEKLLYSLRYINTGCDSCDIFDIFFAFSKIQQFSPGYLNFYDCHEGRKYVAKILFMDEKL